MNIKEIESLIRLVEQSEISELEITKFLGRKIRISKVLKKNPQDDSTTTYEINTEKKNNPQTETTNLVSIKSPMVGIFYRASNPDTPPYVEEGDMVRPGQVVCIVEAMKLMNEIEAEIEGKIIKICVKNEEPVEYGQDLFLIEPLGG